MVWDTALEEDLGRPTSIQWAVYDDSEPRPRKVKPK